MTDLGIGWLKGAQDSVGGLIKGNAGDAWYASMGSAGMILFQAFLFILVIGVVVLIMRKMMMYNIDVYVFKKYANGIKLIKRKGRVRKDKAGIYHFEITKSNPFDFKNKAVALPDQTHFINKGKGDAIFLYQTAAEDYKPILLEEEINNNDELTIGLSVMDLNASNHAIQMHKEVIQRETNKNKMLVYLPTIMMVFGMVFIVVLLWMTLGRIETMNNAMTSGYKLMAEAVNNFGKQIIQ